MSMPTAADALVADAAHAPAARPRAQLAQPPLPPLLVVADSAETGGRPLDWVVARAVAGGARAFWLRDKDCQPWQRRQTLGLLVEIVHSAGGVVLASPGPGSELADGFHLGAALSWPRAAPASGPWPMVGRSCHSRAELDRAAAEGCQWATLSPIFVPTSKPGYGPALGAGAVAGAPLPVWALGGIGPTNAGDCLRAGASGVAVMGAILRAEDPAEAVAAIQERLR